MQTEKTFDVAIAGSALTGLAAAVALGGSGTRTPLSVVLIDQRDPAEFRSAEFDGRASAITEAARRMFEAMGLWQRLAPHAQPMNEIIVTDGTKDRPRPTLLHFGQDDQPGGPSAYMVENRHIYAALHDAVLESSSITLRTGTAVTEYAFTPAHAEATLATGETIRARLLVGADGRNSAARQAAGIEMMGWAYNQSGIVTTVEHEHDHNGRAEEHFLPAGPFAILPLPGRRSSLVWTESNSEAQRMIALPESEFLEELRLRFGAHLGDIKPCGPRHVWPLGLHLAKSFIAPRLTLVGDAAHVIHPIAGLGFNLGLRDVAALADAIFAHYRLGLDPGGAQSLEAYAQMRRLDTLMVAIATDGLNRLFSNDLQVLRMIRDAGLGVVERIAPLKRYFMREASGLSHASLPRLLTGEPA